MFVQTGYVASGGTHANVYITMYGEKESCKAKLETSYRGSLEFEEGE